MIAPVARELERRGFICQVLALTTGYRKALQIGLRPLGYRDFVHLVPNPAEVLARGRELEAGNTHPDVDPDESRWYLGINYFQWIRELGEAGAAARYAEVGRRGFHPLDFMKSVLRELTPDVIVATNSPRTEAAAIEGGVQLGIPTLSMTDLFVGGADAYCRRPVLADRVTTLSPAVRQAMIDAGIEAERLVVTGNPAFDSLAAPELTRQAELLRGRLGWDGRRVILFAGHAEELAGTPKEWAGQGFGLRVQDWLYRWVLDREGDVLVTRFHPSESHLYPPLPPDPRVHRSDPSTAPLHPVLLASDIVVVQTSTVGLEAALAGRRVLCLRFAPSVAQASYNYADLGLAEGVASFEGLAQALSQPGVAPTVDPAEYHVGEAASRVADEVDALVGTRK